MATVTNGGAAGEKSKPPRPKRICFSFAAYAGNLIERLKSSNVAVEEGLSDAEFSSLESNFGFTFPPDLRAILQQGLPVSPRFPNWRSSSAQQLRILINLPASSILRRVANNQFWHPSWGLLPHEPVQTARRLLNDAPRLVPVYRHCYMPCSPNVAGNPIFHIDHDGNVKLLSFDVAGFFSGEEEGPVWAATAARRIGFWSEVADGRGWRWWWLGGGEKGKLSGCLEGVMRRLREGGWNEEEIREMMTATTTVTEEEEEEKQKQKRLKDKEGMKRHVRVLSMILLRAGWSREDVVYSLGDEGNSSWLEFHQRSEEIQPTSTLSVRQHQ